jgi:hypothetical protein
VFCVRFACGYLGILTGSGLLDNAEQCLMELWIFLRALY